VRKRTGWHNCLAYGKGFGVARKTDKNREYCRKFGVSVPAEFLLPMEIMEELNSGGDLSEERKGQLMGVHQWWRGFKKNK
jgi:hypothetical protein